MVVESVFCHWLSLVVEYGAVIHDGLRHTVRHIMGVFYADYRLLGLRDLEWLKGVLKLFI